jgi:hypothetical protein
MTKVIIERPFKEFDHRPKSPTWDANRGEIGFANFSARRGV